MLLRLIKKEVSKWCHARAVMNKCDRTPPKETKKRDMFSTPTLTESVKVHGGSVRLQIQLWVVGVQKDCVTSARDTYPVNPVWVVSAVHIGLHVTGRGYICSTSPGEALTQLQVSRLNYDILPAPCARDIGGRHVSARYTVHISIVAEGIDWYPLSNTRPGGWMSNYCTGTRHCKIYFNQRGQAGK